MVIFPLEKANRRLGVPYAVYGLIALNLAVYLYAAFGGNYRGIIDQYGFVPARHDISTLLTSMFLHAQRPYHVAGNMFFLYMFGDNVEDALGALPFLGAYLLTGVAGGLSHFVLHAQTTVPCIGASGAVSGVLGIYMVLFPKVKADLYLLRWKIATTTILFGCLLWFGEQLLFGFVEITLLPLPIAFWAHAGGMAAGMLIGLACRGLRLDEKLRGRVSAENLKEYLFTCPSCGHGQRIPVYGQYTCKVCTTRFDFSHTGTRILE